MILALPRGTLDDRNRKEGGEKKNTKKKNDVTTQENDETGNVSIFKLTVLPSGKVRGGRAGVGFK